MTDLLLQFRGGGVLGDEFFAPALVGPLHRSSMAMMLLVGAIAMSDDVLKTFTDNQTSLWQKITTGRPLLFVVGYYVLWALVEWKWPMRIAN